MPMLGECVRDKGTEPPNNGLAPTEPFPTLNSSNDLEWGRLYKS
jgi:hypothetical protein